MPRAKPYVRRSHFSILVQRLELLMCGPEGRAGV